MMAKIIPNLGGEMHIHIHEVQKPPNRLNLNSSARRHIIIIFLRVKEKERIVRAAKEKREVVYKIIGWFLNRSCSDQQRMEWDIQNTERK